MRYCNQLLYGDCGFVARCLYHFGVEHSHHDLTAEQAVKQGLAKRGKSYVKRPRSVKPRSSQLGKLQ